MIFSSKRKTRDQFIVIGKEYVFLCFILAAYTVMIMKYYWVLPWRSDELWYCYQVYSPDPNLKLFFRYFNYYIAKIITFGFKSTLEACASVSLLYCLGTITCSYAIILRVAGRTPAIVGAILVATFPTIIYQATYFGTDLSCLFFGMVSIWLSVSVYNRDRFNGIKMFCAGFFLLGAIYSKETGGCFLIPVIMILFPYLRRKRYFYFFIGGVVGGFLFLSICDYIWLNDFFYHVDPGNYLAHLDRFNNQLREDMIGYQSGTNWTSTFFENLVTNAFPMAHIIAYISVYLTLICIPGDRKYENRKYLSFSIFLVSVISLTLHESFHVWYTALKIHKRYMLTIIIPFMLSLCCLLPFNKKEKNEHVSDSGDLFDAALVCIFVVFFFITNRNESYFKELETAWKLGNSLIHVYSFWFLLTGVSMALFFGRKLSLSVKQRRVKYLAYIGLGIIIWYSTTWGNIAAYSYRPTHYAYVPEVISFVSFLKDKTARTYAIESDHCKFTEDSLKHMLLNKDINRSEYSRLMEKRSRDHFKLIIENDYEFLLTHKQYNLDVWNKKEKKYGIHFEKIEKFGECSCFYRIIRN